MDLQWQGAKRAEQKLFQAISILLGHDKNLIAFLFHPTEPKIKKRAGVLRDDAWVFSDQEALAIRAALELWSGSGHVNLWELIENWDDRNWLNFILAICELKDLRAQLLGALQNAPR